MAFNLVYTSYKQLTTTTGELYAVTDGFIKDKVVSVVFSQISIMEYF